MENCNITFPQTQTILNSINIPNLGLDDILAVLNMRDGWRYLLQNINEEVSIEYACRFNSFIARNEALEWGVLRSGSVRISGTDYEPPVPQYEAVTGEMKSILNSSVWLTQKRL